MSIPNEKCVNRRQFIQKSSATTFGIAAGIAVSRCSSVDPEVKKTRSYNSKMEYRRLGQTNLWVSAICLGGHWKRIDKIIGTKKINPYNAPTDDSTLSIFQENRNEIISKCLDVGINCIDLAGDSEAEVYARTLKGRREKMYLAYSHPASELRVPENRTTSKLLELFKAGLKRCNLEYADIWRLMALERGGRHTEKDVEAMVQALEIARKEGLCRFTGFSTHDRQWAKMLIETYPDLMQVMCTPYTAKSKLLPTFAKAATLSTVIVVSVVSIPASLIALSTLYPVPSQTTTLSLSFQERFPTASPKVTTVAVAAETDCPLCWNTASSSLSE